MKVTVLYIVYNQLAFWGCALRGFKFLANRPRNKSSLGCGRERSEELGVPTDVVCIGLHFFTTYTDQQYDQGCSDNEVLYSSLRLI